jgi:hypothetical protein
MSAVELDTVIARLLPEVLADRDLGDGRSFTQLHLRHLWALSCMHVGECYDEQLLEQVVASHLPPKIQIIRTIDAP